MIEKLALLLSLQLKVSSTSLLTTKGCSFLNKLSTSPSTPSLSCLEKQGLQRLLSLPFSPPSATHPSLLTAKNKNKNKNKNWESFFQSLILAPQVFPELNPLLPFPTIKQDLVFISSHSFFMALL